MTTRRSVHRPAIRSSRRKTAPRSFGPPLMEMEAVSRVDHARLAGGSQLPEREPRHEGRHRRVDVDDVVAFALHELADSPGRAEEVAEPSGFRDHSTSNTRSKPATHSGSARRAASQAVDAPAATAEMSRDRQQEAAQRRGDRGRQQQSRHRRFSFVHLLCAMATAFVAMAHNQVNWRSATPAMPRSGRGSPGRTRTGSPRAAPPGTSGPSPGFAATSALAAARSPRTSRIFVGQSRHVARRHQILRRQQFGNAADRRSEARQSSRHRLDHRPRQSLLVRRQHEQIGRIQLAANRFAHRKLAAKMDVFADTEPPGPFLELAAKSPVADQDQLDIGTAGPAARDRVDQHVRRLVELRERADHQRDEPPPSPDRSSAARPRRPRPATRRRRRRPLPADTDSAAAAPRASRRPPGSRAGRSLAAAAGSTSERTAPADVGSLPARRRRTDRRRPRRRTDALHDAASAPGCSPAPTAPASRSRRPASPPPPSPVSPRADGPDTETGRRNRAPPRTPRPAHPSGSSHRSASATGRTRATTRSESKTRRYGSHDRRANCVCVQTAPSGVRSNRCSTETTRFTPAPPLARLQESRLPELVWLRET